MSGVGFWELILLLFIGLIVLGPERLPRVANQLGSWMGQARRMTRVLRRQLEDELNLEKDLNIRPKTQAKPLPATPVPANELDDTYSPAHDATSPGTGVGDTAPGQDPADVPQGTPGEEKSSGSVDAEPRPGSNGKTNNGT